MRFCLFLGAFLTLPTIVFGQISSLNTIINSDSGDIELHSICLDGDSAVYTIGTIEEGPLGQKDLLLIKSNFEGNILWSKVMGSSSIDAGKNCVVKYLSDSTLFVIGFRKETPTSDRDIFYSKLTTGGDVIWSRQFISMNNHDVPRDVIELENHNVVVCGSTASSSFGSTDGFVQEINTTGEVIWSFHYGGNQNDHFYGLVKNEDKIIICGTTESYDGTHRGLVIVLNSTGQIIQETVFLSGSNELFMSVEKVEDVIILVGHTLSNMGVYQPWILGADLNTLQPSWSLSSNSSIDTRLVDVQAIDEDKLILVGNKTGTDFKTPIVWKINKNGEVLSQLQSYSDNEYFEAVSGVITMSPNETDYLFMVKTVEIPGGLSQGSIVRCASDSTLICDFFSEPTSLENQQLNFETIQLPSYSLTQMFGLNLESQVFPIYSTSFFCNFDCNVSEYMNYPTSVCEGDTLQMELLSSDISIMIGDFFYESQDIAYQLTENDSLFIDVSYSINNQFCNLDSGFQISINNYPQEIVLDTALCEAQSLNLTFDDSFLSSEDSSYFGSEINIEAGEHFIGLISNECGSNQIQVTTSQYELPLESAYFISCEDIQIELNDNFVWSLDDGVIDEIFIAQGDSINLVLQATDSLCSQEVHFIVHSPNWLDLLENIPNNFCYVELLDTLSILGFTDLEITKFQTNNTYQIIFQTDDCGTQELLFQDESEWCNCHAGELFMPNSFSPNSDNLNDQFLPLLSCPWDHYQLTIFNRWGEAVFQTQDPQEGWRGDVNGGMHFAMEGIYTWEVEGATGTEFFRETGRVMLIR